ncbi:hypothetical protein [Flavobacterium caseinilyticum]|uniref:Nucleotide-diphospho-sugar transferase domain-containing protein n=1 Tax=Flavobacterium caseinilyticum TaxID=2541732 RepID=A0A4R5AYS8_9FLAO|nr:hypothetical protein [Flavobacterium caseinilyticum]TDD76996.1 hypothetical protein E0F89_05195 [Flavobacterium caseinilyticum]
MVKPKIYFCTFSDSRLQPTLKRIENEAKSSNFFDDIFIFNEFSLNKEFKNKFKDVLNYNSRGYGCYIWKVSIIQDVLSKLKENDILLYTDAGCSINSNGFNKFQDYINLVNESELGILAVSLEDNLLESKYTKGDLFDYLQVRDNEAIYNTPQIQSGLILIKKNKNAEVLFNEWQNVINSSFNLINDEVSISSNFPDFIAHRHDQSIFSILFKMHKGVTIPLSEVWVKQNEDLHLLKDSPIWCMRNKNKKVFGLKYLMVNWINDTLIFKKRM